MEDQDPPKLHAGPDVLRNPAGTAARCCREVRGREMEIPKPGSQGKDSTGETVNISTLAANSQATDTQLSVTLVGDAGNPGPWQALTCPTAGETWGRNRRFYPSSQEKGGRRFRSSAPEACVPEARPPKNPLKALCFRILE